MPSMREIRERISSIQDIHKITNAMYLISSSKLKKVRKNLAATEPYFHKLQTTLDDILVHTPSTKQRFFDKRPSIPEENRKKGYIIITADKGLCGSYNHNILRLAEQEIAKSDNCRLFIIGQVGRMYFERRIRSGAHASVDSEFLYTAKDPTLYTAREIAETVLDIFVRKELDDIYIIFTDMISSSKFVPTIKQILPFSRLHFGMTEDGTMKKMPKADFLPSPEVVMEYLIPNYVKGLIYGAMVEAFSCEQQSRMTAMDAATTSAKDMLKNLSLVYNRARQAAITQEINEVISGTLGTHDSDYT